MKGKIYRHSKSGYRFFIFTIFITLIALIASVYFTFSSFYKIAKSDAISIGEKAIYESTEKLNNFLLNGMDVLTVTSETVEYMMRKEESVSNITDYLRFESELYKKTINENFTGIYGFLDENYVDGTDWIPEEGYDPKTRDWYKGALWSLGKATIVPPYVDAQTGKIIISVAKMLYDWSVLALDIQLDELVDYMKNIKTEGYSFIIDRSGMVVACSENRKVSLGENLLEERKDKKSSRQEFSKNLARAIFIRNEQPTKSDSLILDGEKCIVFSQQVQNDWFVVAVVSESELFARIRLNLIRNIGLSILILLVVIYFCASSFIQRRKANSNAEIAEKNAEELRRFQQGLKDTIEKQTILIKNQTKELVTFQSDVIEGVAQLIESRDGSTGEHVKNTKKYVLFLANYLYEHNFYPEEIDRKFIETIGNAATLHDVGKIHIEDKILRKQDRLSDEEYRIMKSHAAKGGEVIDKIFGKSNDEYLVKITHDVVKHHHERWDGKGYPDGIKGFDIPLSSRIMAIADVYDALLSKRAYKAAMSKDVVIQKMREGRGSQFDPQLLDIFLEIIESN